MTRPLHAVAIARALLDPPSPRSPLNPEQPEEARPGTRLARRMARVTKRAPQRGQE